MSENETDIDWMLVEKIFHEVAELDDAARETYWTKASHSAPIPSIVESLLNHDRAMPRIGQANQVLDSDVSLATTPAPVLHPADSVGKSNQLMFSPGAIVDDIELLYPVAQTTHSEVWCGQHADSNRRVAVKFLRDATSNAKHAERFVREVEVLKRLKHPNIASILGSGNTVAGNPYFVMQWIDGVPITDYCDQNQLTVRQRVSLVCSLCDAIDYANKFLIVHRDLKPDNILVQDNGEISVLDFGIAKIISSEDSSNLIELTQSHERVLTPAYASPEQNRGEAISTATDVHGIGIVLFQLLCGHHPFSDTAQPIETELFDRVCSGVPNSPSQLVSLESVTLTTTGAEPQRKNPQLLAGYRQSSPNQLRRTLSGKLDLICAAALKKNPVDRIARAIDLRDELSNWTENRPLNLQSSNRSISHWLHRNPVRSVVVSSLICGLLSGLTVFLFAQSRYSQDQADIDQLSSELRSSQQVAAASRQANDALRGTLDLVVGGERDGIQGAEALRAQQSLLELKSAQMLAEQGDYSGARNLIAKLSSSPPTELQDRILLARTVGLLGNTTQGISLLSDLIDAPEVGLRKMDAEQRRFATRTMTELMLDAGWPRLAVDMKERQFLPDDPQRHDIENRDLLDVRLLVAMEEFDIAAERLVELDGSDQAATLSRDQRMDRLLLGIEIAIGKGESKDALNQIEALPAQFGADVVRRVKLLRARAALESNAAEKEMLLQQGLEELSQSELSDHSLGVRLAGELAMLSEKEATPEQQSPWIENAWQQVEKTSEFGLREAFELVELRCDYVKDDESVDAVLSDSGRLHSFRALTCSSPYRNRVYASKLMRIALDPESQQPAKENRKGVVEREANQFLNSVKESSENASSDIAFASLAILECEPTTASALKTATANSKSHLSLELKSQQQPVRILLQLALASMDRKELGRTIHWIHRYQNYSNSDLDNQLNAIVYIAEDCQSKNHFAAAEFIVEQFLSSKAGSGDELEYQVRAAKVIARLPNRSGESTALIKQVVERLRESDDSEWEAELPAIELIAAFYSGDAESLKIAQRLQEQHPDSGPLRTAIWNITQAMEANDDERLPAWRAGL